MPYTFGQSDKSHIFMSYETLQVEQIDAVCRITLNQPAKLNALSKKLIEELLEACSAAGRDDAVRAVIITGAGRGFSSGADLSDPASMPKPGELPDLGASLEDRYNPLLTVIREMPKPVIAAVNGTAAGAGCNIALACDFVLAADTAKFLQAFIKIGLVPDAGGTWTIPRLIGRSRALRWMMTGETIDAATALEWGLVMSVHPVDALPEVALEWAQKLAAAPTAALGRIKTLVDSAEYTNLQDQLQAEADAQRLCGRSPDFGEGVMAFLQKRPPKFSGK